MEQLGCGVLQGEESPNWGGTRMSGVQGEENLSSEGS